MAGRFAGAWLGAALVALISCDAPTFRGEIDDAEIRLEREVFPASLWLELANVGAQPCELVAMLSPLPADALPVENGQIVTSLSGDPDVVIPIESYVESIDGQPVVRGAAGAAIVDPGDRVRVQLGFKSAPDVGVLVIACNAPGDYEAGRYAFLAFER